MANFHHETIHNLVELLAAAGLDNLDQLRPDHINRRVNGTVVKTYRDLYPPILDKCLLSGCDIPENWKEDWSKAQSGNW